MELYVKKVRARMQGREGEIFRKKCVIFFIYQRIEF
jgi:hypothetical protein